MQRLLFIIMQISLLITMLMSWCPPVKVVEGLRPGVYPRFFLPVFNHVSSVTEFFIFLLYQFTSSASQQSLKCHIFLKFHHSFLTFHYKCLVQNPISLISKASLFFIVLFRFVLCFPSSLQQLFVLNCPLSEQLCSKMANMEIKLVELLQ